MNHFSSIGWLYRASSVPRLLLLASFLVLAQGANGSGTLALDDGTHEDAVGSMLGGEFIWLNRFTLSSADTPFIMDQVQILFPAGSGVSQGELIDIHIYTDPDGDGDPATGMQLRHSIRNAAVEAVDGITWSSYSAASLHFTESHDIMIAVVNRTAGTDLGEKPAALDQTTSLGQSWIGINASETISDPPTFPTDIVWGTTDSVGFPGNWMIRATTRLPAAAEAAHPVPSMTAVGSVLLTLLMVAFGGAYRNRKENLENG